MSHEEKALLGGLSALFTFTLSQTQRGRPGYGILGRQVSTHPPLRNSGQDFSGLIYIWFSLVNEKSLTFIFSSLDFPITWGCHVSPHTSQKASGVLMPAAALMARGL